jgi:hypothetical protein
MDMTRTGAIKTHVVAFHNDKGQIASWVGRKGQPVALREADAKRFAPGEAERLARRYTAALTHHGMTGFYTAAEATV